MNGDSVHCEISVLGSNPRYILQDAEQEPCAAAVDAPREHLLRQVLHRVRRLVLRSASLGDIQLWTPG